MKSLRAHVDGHLLKHLPGMPPDSWLQEHRLTGCRVCGLSVSISCNQGIHHKCLDKQLQEPYAQASGMPRDTATDELPSLDGVMRTPIATREFIGDGLLPIVEREFNKCGANVLAFSRSDAWDHEGKPSDTPSQERARRAWIEWLMFASASSPTWREGKAETQRQFVGESSEAMG